MTTAILSHLNHNTWGEKVPAGGWITAGAMLAACIMIPLFYFVERRQWLSKWRFTTRHGIQCFFDDGAKLYERADVEDITAEMYARWGDYYDKYGDKKSQGLGHNTLSGSICIFVAPFPFKQQTAGFKERLVCGLAGWNWMKVGQGDRPIEKTAYMHEASHIHLNQIKGHMVPEDESHETFKSVGV